VAHRACSMRRSSRVTAGRPWRRSSPSQACASPWSPSQVSASCLLLGFGRCCAVSASSASRFVFLVHSCVSVLVPAAFCCCPPRITFPHEALAPAGSHPALCPLSQGTRATGAGWRGAGAGAPVGNRSATGRGYAVRVVSLHLLFIACLPSAPPDSASLLIRVVVVRRRRGWRFGQPNR
jgi:hypothetical protein